MSALVLGHDYKLSRFSLENGMIVLRRNDETAERTVTVYDPKFNIYFHRPLYGIEVSLTDDEIITRMKTRFKKWKVS